MQTPVPSVRRFFAATLAGFLGTVVSGTLLAMVILGPLLTDAFGPAMRDPDRDGLLMPALLGGYVVIALTLAYLYPRLNLGGSAWSASSRLGAALGLAVFFGGHLVIAGWSRMPPAPMAISGVIDALSAVVGAWLVARVYQPWKTQVNRS